MMTDSAAVRVVQIAYSGALGKRGIKLKVLPPKSGGRFFKDCVEFYLLAEELGTSVTTLMENVVEMYPAAWCKKAFNRPYVPFYEAVASKSRLKVIKFLPPESRDVNLHSKVTEFVSQLLKLERSVADEFVHNGTLTGGNKKLQDALEKRWKEVV